MFIEIDKGVVVNLEHIKTAVFVERFVYPKETERPEDPARYDLNLGQGASNIRVTNPSAIKKITTYLDEQLKEK